MSWQATAWARRQIRSLGRAHSAALLLMVLADYHSAYDGTVIVTQARLGEDCGMPVRTVRWCLARLVERGLVAVAQKGNQHQPSVFRLGLDDATMSEQAIIAGAGHAQTGEPARNDTEPGLAGAPMGEAVTSEAAIIAGTDVNRQDGACEPARSEPPQEDLGLPLKSKNKKGRDWIGPEWWEPMMRLDGYVRRAYAKTVDTVSRICAEAEVEPMAVVDGFAAYWPTGRFRHGWRDPASALLRSINVQIAKVKGNRGRGGTRVSNGPRETRMERAARLKQEHET